MIKTFNFYFFLLLISIFTLTISCKDKEETPEPVVQSGPVGNDSDLPVNSGNSVSKKWFVDGTALRTTGTTGISDYAWFDFSPYGIYVIMKTDETVYSGAYTYDAATNLITCDGFGVVEITTVSATKFTFTVTPTGEVGVDLLSSVGTEVDATSKTAQLARAWKLVSQTEDGVDTGLNSSVDSVYVVITKYGTHMLAIKNHWLMGDMFIPQVWQWSEATQARICVGDVTPDCSADQLTITLTSDNKMIAVYASNGGGTMREEYVELIVQ